MWDGVNTDVSGYLKEGNETDSNNTIQLSIIFNDSAIRFHQL
jgi:hypothetical protein